MIVSSQLFEAYIECATKCWLRSRAEPTAGNAYAEWARAQNEAYRQDGLNKLLAILPESDFAMEPLISRNSKDATWRIAIDVRLRTNGDQVGPDLQATNLPEAENLLAVLRLPIRENEPHLRRA
jgi:predicted ester cyclase